MTSSAILEPQVEPSLKNYACLPCRQRKVKCDRGLPACAHCIKAGKECSFVAPVRGVRKRTKPIKEGLHAKLKRYEDLLRSYGVKIEPDDDVNGTPPETVASEIATPGLGDDMNEDDETEGVTPLPSWHASMNDLKETTVTSRPKLITKEGSSRYFDSALWSKMGDDSRHPEWSEPADRADKSDTRVYGLFFGNEPMSRPEKLESLHFPSTTLSKLKEIYADRVDPLIKIFHLPTFWSSLSNGLSNPNGMPKDLQAATFAFYLAVIRSLSPDESLDLFGQSKSAMYSLYESTTRQALLEAKFLATSSLMTLRAFAMFLQCVRNDYSCDILYVFSGLVIRLACKMGLHRDGSTLGLSPFDTEMRRRLWWHLVLVDLRTSDVLGVKPSLDLSSGDTKLPRNIDDDDLVPGMTSFPSEMKGITSISFCIIRCEMISALKSPSDTCLPSGKDGKIDQIEDHLETRYLRYCEPSNTLHMFISIIVRSLLCKIRLTAHNPQIFSRRPATQAERNIVFSSATKLLEYITFMHNGHPGLKKYLWQTGNSFLWNAMLYVLIEMRHRKTGSDVEKAWKTIGKLFDGYPQVFQTQTDPVFVALGKWTLEVWDDCVDTLRQRGLDGPTEPSYIAAIRRCRRPAVEAETSLQPAGGNSINNEPSQTQATGGDDLVMEQPLDLYDFPDLLSFEMNPDEWIQWEQLMSEPINLGQNDSMQF